MKYIVVEGKSLSTLKGIVSHPKDFNKPTQKELIEEKDISGGKEVIEKLVKAGYIKKWKKKKEAINQEENTEINQEENTEVK